MLNAAERQLKALTNYPKQKRKLNIEYDRIIIQCMVKSVELRKMDLYGEKAAKKKNVISQNI